jgi:hypothetical protein
MPIRRRGKRKTAKSAVLLHTCAWCKLRVAEGSEVFSVGAKLKDVAVLSGQAGRFLHLELLTIPGKTVHCIIVADDSEAKKQGWDLALMACSQDCAASLRDAMRKEIYIGELFGGW